MSRAHEPDAYTFELPNDDGIERLDHEHTRWILDHLSPRSKVPEVAERWRMYESEEWAVAVYETILWVHIRSIEAASVDPDEDHRRRVNAFNYRLGHVVGYMKRFANQTRDRELKDRMAVEAAERRRVNSAMDPGRQAHFSKLYGRLINAVDEHRRVTLASDIEPEPHDLALWEAAHNNPAYVPQETTT